MSNLWKKIGKSMENIWKTTRKTLGNFSTADKSQNQIPTKMWIYPTFPQLPPNHPTTFPTTTSLLLKPTFPHFPHSLITTITIYLIRKDFQWN